MRDNKRLIGSYIYFIKNWIKVIFGKQLTKLVSDRQLQLDYVDRLKNENPGKRAENFF